MAPRPATIVLCALAVAAASIAASGEAATRTGRTPALASRTVRLGTASGVLILPPHPRTLAIVIHGGEIAWDRTRATRATRVAARVYATHLAPLGIGVLSVGYRWSGYGGGELRDVEASLAWAANSQPVAQLPKILVGGSHGGRPGRARGNDERRPRRSGACRRRPVRVLDLGETVTGQGSRSGPAGAADAARARSAPACPGRLRRALAALPREPVGRAAAADRRQSRPRDPARRARTHTCSPPGR